MSKKTKDLLMENDEKNRELETENRRLRERLEHLEAYVTSKRAVRYRVFRAFAGTFAGKPLYESVTQLVKDLSEKRVVPETIRDVAYATLRRLTRVGTITLLIAVAPLSLAVIQTYYLKKQNEKFDLQNKRIEQQTYLQEAERRSSLVFLIDNTLDRMDDELRRDPVGRMLSPQLVGRIVALSKALKPYRYLEGDTITSRQTSPERGQLLLSLVASKLNRNTYDQIFLLADFSYATLQNVSLDGAYLPNINLSYAQLQTVSLTGATLRSANFTGAELFDAYVVFPGVRRRSTNFDFANFHDAVLNDSDFSGGSFRYANFSGARLRNVVFREAFFHNAKFPLIAADTLNFSQATLLRTSFTLPGDERVTIALDGVRLDSSTFVQLSSLPLTIQPRVNFERPEFRITRDSFYPDDKSQPLLVVDSLRIFRIGL